MTPTTYHNQFLSPDSFRAFADAGHHMEICEVDGDPALRAAQLTLNDRILYALSYVPVLKHWEPVAKFARELEIKNAQVLRVFIQSLSERYGPTNAESAIRNLDLTGATPLQSRTIERLIESAETGPSLCGFRNLGNTCYANTALKFLINSIGENRLVAHLEHIQQNASDSNKQDCAKKFVDLIKATHESEKPLHRELHDFFNSLQEQENFRAGPHGSGFTVIGDQNDTQEFLMKLSDCCDLENLNTNVLQIQETYVNGQEKRDPKIADAAYCQHANLSSREQANFSLQQIVNTLTTRDDDVSVRWNDDDRGNTTVTRIQQWTASDVQKVDRFNLHINAMDYNSEELTRLILNADFTKPVRIPVIDQKTGIEWTLTLEPRDIIIHAGGAVGESDTAGHYYMYSRREQDSWTLHDDETVKRGKDINRSEQAKMISFAVTGRERVRPPFQVSNSFNFHMPEKFTPRA
ncbi:type III secretion system effector BopA family protein [Bordetella muralis]|uniref:type III secretion system effector BopA family protein n=1 Tax=Bordetella muralis TaxID=1649130 RepID=UPI0039EF04AF